jgi:hypothetical protein
MRHVSLAIAFATLLLLGAGAAQAETAAVVPGPAETLQPSAAQEAVSMDFAQFLAFVESSGTLTGPPPVETACGVAACVRPCVQDPFCGGCTIQCVDFVNCVCDCFC